MEQSIDFAHLESAIQNLLAKTQISGLTLAVVQDGNLAYDGAFGQIQDARFEVASLSKLVFAYGVVKLAEQGVIDLDSPLSEYLPAPYVLDEPNLHQITARHVLSHSSGFPNWRNEQGLRVQFPVGSAFLYSTEGMIYLQTVLEHLLQKPFADYLQTHLLEPFGMLQSHFLPSDMSAFPPYLPRHLASICSVSLQTTAADYARFLMGVMCETCEDEFHLKPASREEMLKPQITVGDQENLFWGLGFGLQVLDDITHSFWHWGVRLDKTRNFAMGIPNNCSGVVILVNGSQGLTICEPILQLLWGQMAVYPALKWLLPPERWRGDGRKV